MRVFHHCPSLSCHAAEVEKILGDWKSYKMSVPTFGAIMLDPERKYVRKLVPQTGTIFMAFNAYSVM